MATQFGDWLTQVAASGAGGSAAELRPLRKGAQYGVQIDLASEATFGDWTSGSFSMEFKATPDLTATVLASPTVTTGTPASGVTPLTVTLGGNAQSLVPDPGDTYVSELVYELIYTPTTGGKNVILAGRVPLIGGVVA